jgi:formylglycine-generating enzyme required for sulfatase activity
MSDFDVDQKDPSKHPTAAADGEASPNISRPPAGMIYIPGGTFRMGSDKHYPEEAPDHRVTVNSFWIDRAPVTNREFRKFVNATGYVTFAEIKPDPKDYPGALPHMLKAGSLVFTPTKHAVDTRDWSQWSAKLRLQAADKLKQPLRVTTGYGMHVDFVAQPRGERRHV